jgi:hypothetical protein
MDWKKYSVKEENNMSKYILKNQSLVGPVVIDCRLGREDHCSIICNCNREGTETT